MISNKLLHNRYSFPMGKGPILVISEDENNIGSFTQHTNTHSSNQSRKEKKRREEEKKKKEKKRKNKKKKKNRKRIRKKERKIHST